MVETMDRPKMPRATWEALRNHIMRERARKKQEIETTQEFERLKKERERKKKQEALSLEDTKEQISQLELKLSACKDEKHALFNTLKKVLFEDETRRRKEPHPSHMYLQSSGRQNSIYMKPQPPHSHSHHHMFLGAGALSATPPPTSLVPPSSKRQRSPSPPSSRNTLPSNYYRSSPLPQVSLAKYGNYSVGVTAASTLGGYTLTNSSYYSAAAAARSAAVAEEDRNKHLYAAAAAASSARSYSLAAAAVDRERAALLAAQRLPIPAHGASQQPPTAAAVSLTQVYRPGSIMTGYPRYAPPSTNRPSPSPPSRTQAPPSSNGGSSSGVRYFGALQREI